MQWKLERHLVLWGFVLAAAILAFAGWESYRNTVRVAEAADARKHSYEVGRMIDETLTRLVDAETWQRGFLLTGDEAYLKPYREAIKNLDRVMDELKNLTSDNPNQQEQVQALEPLIELKLTELQKAIEIRKEQGLEAANQVVLAGEGKQLMDQIRTVLAEMTNEESNLRNVRTQEMANALTRNTRTVVVGNLLSMLLLLLVFAILLRELSERNRAREALSKSEKWLSTTLASVGDAVIATDMNGTVTFMNPAAQLLTGWSQSEATGKSMDLVLDIVNEETRGPVENPVKKVFREGKVVGLADNTVLRSKNGKEIHIEDSAAPILADTGEKFGVVLVFRDITEKKLAAEALKTSERRLNLALDSAEMGIWDLDLVNDKAYRSVRHDQIFGYPSLQSEWGYEIFLTHVVPEDRDAVKKSFEEAFASGDFNMECRIIWPDKSIHWVSAQGRAFRNDKGDFVRMMGTVSDITERKRAEEEQHHQQKILQSILGSMGDGVVVADANGKFLLFNAAAEQIVGIGATDALPDQWSDRYGSYLPDTVTPYPSNELPLVRAMRGESVDAAELFIRNANVPDGRFLRVTGRPLRGEDGALRGGVVVFHDISLQNRAKEALILAKEEAERTSRFKDQFLSTMSHELRTPLNAILGFSELLPDERYGTLNERQRRYVNNIHSGGRHLLRLINDILDLSKIEAGRLELAIESVRVETAFGEVLSAMRPLADKKSQTLSQHAETGLVVRADATRFRQVLMNLVGNANKFTPEGGRIELSARGENGQVRIEVHDTGPGIPPEEQKRIFEAFYRLRQSGQATEGTGLGLAITQRLVELHGGQLGLESQPGQGSCFYFSLPAAAVVLESPSKATVTRLRTSEARRILVIEDDPTAGQLIQSQLTSSGYTVVVCDEPGRAAQLAAEIQPHAITLDLVMKPTTGWEILVQLKRQPSTASIPVIVVTIVDEPSVGAMLGADEYLVKPVDKTALLAAVERCLAAREGAPPVRPILVVEDDKRTREFIAELLNAQGYAVDSAADGAAARAWVAASLPELVILDLMLPTVSGFELLAEWRANPRTADLPVFVLTSKDLSREEEQYLRVNAESLFRKHQPWQEALVKQLQRVLSPGQLERA